MSETINTNLAETNNEQAAAYEVLSTERAAKLGSEAILSAREAKFREFLRSKKRPDEMYMDEHPGATHNDAVMNTSIPMFNDHWAEMLVSISDGKMARPEDLRSKILSNFTISEIISDENCPTILDFQNRVRELGFDKRYAKESIEYAERAIYGEEQLKSLQAYNSIGEVEKLVVSSYERMLSKKQLEEGDYASRVEIGAEDGRSRDAAYVDNKNAVFAVFDGVGDSGRPASHRCADVLGAAIEKVAFRSNDGKKAVVEALNNSLVGLESATTAVVAKVVREQDGGKSLHYVSVGDSRLYVVHRNGQAEQITHDDVMSDEQISIMTTRKKTGNKMTTAMAMAYDAAQGREKKAAVLASTPIRADLIVSAASYVRRLREHGIGKSLNGGRNGSDVDERNIGAIRLAPGDQVVLCSDGITGDVGGDVRSERDIAAAVCGRSADEATRNLFMMATKYDDRTAIVVNT